MALKNRIVWLLLVLNLGFIFAQQSFIETISLEEYLAYVKQHHPVIKQANLSLSMSESKLLKARGALDPTLSFSYDTKEFKSTNYWNKFNSTFKVPTIFGVDFKVDYQQNSGDFVNPELTVPKDGLYSAGVSIDLARGLLMNERRAQIRQRKYFIKQTEAERDLLINNLVYQASLAYLEWLRYYNEELIFSEYLKNAKLRLEGVERSAALGDKPEIDITEARINYTTTQINLEKTKLNRVKARLKASNYLWFNELPLELSTSVKPIEVAQEELIGLLNLEGTINPAAAIEDHPKLNSINFKTLALVQDYKLKQNLLLPKLALNYNFLTASTNNLGNLNTQQYKSFVSLKLPLFMRKQRAELKLAKLKLRDIEQEKLNIRLALKNKLEATNEQLLSYDKQRTLLEVLVSDYNRLYAAEQRKFDLGESSLFLVNTRERKLYDVKIKENAIKMVYIKTILQLFNVAGIKVN